MASRLAQIAYRILERLDGEKGVKLIAYSRAVRIKAFLYPIIDDER